MSRRYLIIVNRAPGIGTLSREAIDLVLVAGAFDLDPAVLFVDGGVLHLAPSEAAATHRPVEALPTYGISRIYADAESLLRHRLAADSLRPAATISDGSAIARLVADADIVLTA